MDELTTSVLDPVADELAALPGVVAVALGGSRARGRARADSDWDVSVYYRAGFDPDSVRRLGHPGQLSDLGGWGPTFNGGGKLTVGELVIDLHYCDLALIEQIREAADRSRGGSCPARTSDPVRRPDQRGLLHGGARRAGRARRVGDEREIRPRTICAEAVRSVL